MALSTSPSDPPLLCRLGRHSPRPIARWNNGYYFSTCRRCGTDLVRTAFGGWQVPKGFRVVWQAAPPADTGSVRLEPTAAAAAAAVAAESIAEPAQSEPVASEPLPTEPPPAEASASEPSLFEAAGLDEPDRPAAAAEETADGELAIGKLLRHLHDNPPEQAPAPEPEIDEPPRRGYDPNFIPDFMDDNPGRALAPAAPPEPAGPEAPAPAGPSIATRLLGWGAALLAASRRGLGDLRARIAAQRSQTDQPGIDGQYVGTPAVAFLTSLIIIAAIIYLAGGPGGADRVAPRAAAPAPSPAVAQAMPAAPAISAPSPAGQVQAALRDPAFITASIVNCRSAPARQAPPVRRIVRGERVDVLALDQNWASVAYRGGQCWVLVRYISTIEPLAEGPALGSSRPPALGAMERASSTAPGDYRCAANGYPQQRSSPSPSSGWGSSPPSCTNM